MIIEYSSSGNTRLWGRVYALNVGCPNLASRDTQTGENAKEVCLSAMQPPQVMVDNSVQWVLRIACNCRILPLGGMYGPPPSRRSVKPRAEKSVSSFNPPGKGCRTPPSDQRTRIFHPSKPKCSPPSQQRHWHPVQCERTVPLALWSPAPGCSTTIRSTLCVR